MVPLVEEQVWKKLTDGTLFYVALLEHLMDYLIAGLRSEELLMLRQVRQNARHFLEEFFMQLIVLYQSMQLVMHHY